MPDQRLSIKYQPTLPKIKFQVSLYAGTIIESEPALSIRTSSDEKDCALQELTRRQQRTKPMSTLKMIYGEHHDLVSPYNVAVFRLISDVFATAKP